MRRFESGVTPALRFGSDDGTRYAPAFLADVPDTAAKLAWLKAEIARDLDVFARNPRRFLDLYFDFIAAQLSAEAGTLTALLQPLGGVFRIEDWSFAALRPIPNAVVFDADLPDAGADAGSYDMAFWSGDKLLAIRFQGGTPSAASEKETGRLEQLGMEAISIPPRELTSVDAAFSRQQFPETFLRFWQGATYPCSPFRPQGLSETLSAK